eukprot:2792773-Alexandrium_andersonii.AAC.1
MLGRALAAFCDGVAERTTPLAKLVVDANKWKADLEPGSSFSEVAAVGDNTLLVWTDLAKQLTASFQSLKQALPVVIPSCVRRGRLAQWEGHPFSELEID